MALPVFTTTANQPEVVVDGVQGKMRDVTCFDDGQVLMIITRRAPTS